jgi:hypothetical protein
MSFCTTCIMVGRNKQLRSYTPSIPNISESTKKRSERYLTESFVHTVVVDACLVKRHLLVFKFIILQELQHLISGSRFVVKTATQ